MAPRESDGSVSDRSQVWTRKRIIFYINNILQQMNKGNKIIRLVFGFAVGNS